MWRRWIRGNCESWGKPPAGERGFLMENSAKNLGFGEQIQCIPLRGLTNPKGLCQIDGNTVFLFCSSKNNGRIR